MNMLALDAALVGLPRHLCHHHPPCPDWDTPAHDLAKVVNRHDEIGVSVLCNGVWLYDDTGESSPTGVATAPHRPAAPHVGGAL
jgi:hypothetical protein